MITTRFIFQAAMVAYGTTVLAMIGVDCWIDEGQERRRRRLTELRQQLNSTTQPVPLRVVT